MVGDDVRTLLRDYINSFECLETLLLLRREGTAWTAEELSARLNIRAPLLDDALASLVRARLVETTDQKSPISYTYAHEHPVQDAVVGSLDCAYREEPIEIMQLMSMNAIERLRTRTIRAFAEAFVVRKDKNRG